MTNEELTWIETAQKYRYVSTTTESIRGMVALADSLVRLQSEIKPVMYALASAWIGALNWHTDEDGREWLLVDPEPEE